MRRLYRHHSADAQHQACKLRLRSLKRIPLVFPIAPSHSLIREDAVRLLACAVLVRRAMPSPLRTFSQSASLMCAIAMLPACADTPEGDGAVGSSFSESSSINDQAYDATLARSSADVGFFVHPLLTSRIACSQGKMTLSYQAETTNGKIAVRLWNAPISCTATTLAVTISPSSVSLYLADRRAEEQWQAVEGQMDVEIGEGKGRLRLSNAVFERMGMPRIGTQSETLYLDGGEIFGEIADADP